MKKHIPLALCAVLLIVSMVFLPTIEKDVKLGAGNQKNAKVETLDEVTGFLEFLSDGGYSQDESLYADNPIVTLAVGSGWTGKATSKTEKATSKTEKATSKTEKATSSATDTEDDTLYGDETERLTETKKPTYGNKKFSSGTVHQTAYVSSNSSSSGAGYSSSSSMAMNRTLSIYIGKDASYYSSKASMTVSSSQSGDGKYENKSASIMWDIEFYIERNRTLVKFNSFNAHGEGNGSSFSLPKEVLNKWIDFSDEMPDIDSMNREGLSLIADIIWEYEKDGFVKKGNIYTLKDKHDITDDIKIDLSDATSPRIDLKQKVDESQSFETYSYSQTLNGDYCFTFENINNTVVEFNDNVEIYDIHDFDDLDMEGIEDVF